MQTGSMKAVEMPPGVDQYRDDDGCQRHKFANTPCFLTAEDHDNNVRVCYLCETRLHTTRVAGMLRHLGSSALDTIVFNYGVRVPRLSDPCASPDSNPKPSRRFASRRPYASRLLDAKVVPPAPCTRGQC